MEFCFTILQIPCLFRQNRPRKMATVTNGFRKQNKKVALILFTCRIVKPILSCEFEQSNFFARNFSCKTNVVQRKQMEHGNVFILKWHKSFPAADLLSVGLLLLVEVVPLLVLYRVAEPVGHQALPQQIPNLSYC